MHFKTLRILHEDENVVLDEIALIVSSLRLLIERRP